MLKNSHDGFAIALAWPETLCKQAGAWYDNLMHFVGVNSKGYYKVGHAAIILVDGKSGKCQYFDFGRYHAPHGHGRVRSTITDHELKIDTKARFSDEKTNITNLADILFKLQNNTSTHGSGTIYASAVRINYSKAFQFALGLNKRDYIPYGPFIRKGTNCSRFVNSVLQIGISDIKSSIRLNLPWMLTPTPMWNLHAINGNIISVSKASKSIRSENINPNMVYNA